MPFPIHYCQLLFKFFRVMVIKVGKVYLVKSEVERNLLHNEKRPDYSSLNGFGIKNVGFRAPER